MSAVHYAHTLSGRPPHDWEPLLTHLLLVAEGDPGSGFDGATGFAGAFGGGSWGRLAGLWHDLGKYSAAFQDYLCSHTARINGGGGHEAELMGRVDHSTAGAQHAVRRFGSMGRLLAYCIAGHHAGLPDDVGSEAALAMRLKRTIPAFADAPDSLLAEPLPAPPKLHTSGDRRRAAFAIGFYIRMLFSCLVDADFLATEAFMDQERAAKRPRTNASLADLLARLDRHLAEKERGAPDTVVNRCRREVLKACREKAEDAPGLFSLTVPTGGGKTLSSLAFALTHAATHSLRRVVYAIPFTSIIEQTADVFRKAMADLASEVLEHHSNLDPGDPDRQTERSRLAAENWDASLVVTTNVQLFESLFASRTSRCRKLHRLARSVIILDEAQTLPPNLLTPTLAALDELVRNCGATVVLCTATQPAIEKRETFPIGLEKSTPIIKDPIALHHTLRRTQVELCGKLSDSELAVQLGQEFQVLCIVNSRKHAAELYKLLGDSSGLHLSANMCARHRSAVLRLIRWRLRRGQSCRVISTQVIEAGVDVDFPVVYRATAGLDSVAQAAGRCNREGQLRTDTGELRPGRVIVFEYDQREYRTARMIERGADHFREVAPNHRKDLLCPAAIKNYFRLNYWSQGGDDLSGWDLGRGHQSVMDCFGGDSGDPLHHQFRQAADRYQLIDDAQTSVLVPYGSRGRALIHMLERMPNPPGREFDRAAQFYIVGVHELALRNLRDSGVVVERHGRHYLANPEAYRAVGLTTEVDPGWTVI